MTEYQKTFDLMVQQNKELFENFKDIHDAYALNPKEWQKLFNEYGGEVMDIMREYERKLLSNMGTGKYGQFSIKVSEKYWAEIKALFPKIEFIGVTLS